MQVRVIIPFEAGISYILDVPEPTFEAVSKVLLSDDFDPANWEHDPNFYEQVWDNVKQATCNEKAVEIEPYVKEDEDDSDQEE